MNKILLFLFVFKFQLGTRKNRKFSFQFLHNQFKINQIKTESVNIKKIVKETGKFNLKMKLLNKTIIPIIKHLMVFPIQRVKDRNKNSMKA